MHRWKLVIIFAFLAHLPVSAEQWQARNAAEVAAAAHQAAPGDVIVLTNGRWEDQYLRFEARGTPQAPVTLRAQTPGQVFLTGSSRLDIAGPWLVAQGLRFESGALQHGQNIIRFTDKSSHSQLTESAIINYNPPDRSTRYFWVALYGDHNTVDHSLFQGQDHSGVTLAVVHKNDKIDAHTIKWNYFLDHKPGDGNGFETIRIGTSDSSQSRSETTIQHNLFERTDGEIEIISIKSGGNTIAFNTFRQAAGTVTLRHGSNNRIVGNYFLGDHIKGSGGIRIMGDGHTVENNVLQNLQGLVGGAIVFYCSQPDAAIDENPLITNVKVRGNSIVNSQTPAFNFDAGCGTLRRSVLPEAVAIENNTVIESRSDFSHGIMGPHWTLQDNIYIGKPDAHLPAAGVTRGDTNLKITSAGVPGIPGKSMQAPLTSCDVGPSWMRHCSPSSGRSRGD